MKVKNKSVSRAHIDRSLEKQLNICCDQMMMLRSPGTPIMFRIHESSVT